VACIFVGVGREAATGARHAKSVDVRVFGGNMYQSVGHQTIRTLDPLYLFSKRNIPFWLSRFSPLYHFLPHPSTIYIILYPLWGPLITYLNISMRDLDLKDLLKRIQWCNWSLIWFCSLWVKTFFYCLKRWGPTLQSPTHACACTLCGCCWRVVGPPAGSALPPPTPNLASHSPPVFYRSGYCLPLRLIFTLNVYRV
jgi:hypothetical protein